MRQACADVRALFLDTGGQGDRLHAGRTCDPRRQNPSQRRLDRPGLLDARRRGRSRRQGDRQRRAQAAPISRPSAASSARLDLPAKIFGDAAFIHDMGLDGMVHARVVRQPNRGATIEAVDEAAIRRAAKAPIEFVRNGNFLAIIGDDETAVEAAGAAAVNHVSWQNVEAPTPLQQEASWLLQRPSIDRIIGPPEPADAQGRERFEATYTQALSRPCLDLAVLRPRRLSRRPSDGMDALPGRVSAARRAGAHARARCLPPLPCITCRGPAATATTAPTMPPPMPPSSPCRCRACRSGCAGGARRNSSTSRRRRQWW